jgi:hypothetical protein
MGGNKKCSKKIQVLRQRFHTFRIKNGQTIADARPENILVHGKMNDDLKCLPFLVGAMIAPHRIRISDPTRVPERGTLSAPSAADTP